ncbi:MAG: nucleotide-binding protein [Dongiaceae bacterium]
MDKDTAIGLLTAAGYDIISDERLPNDTGSQLKLQTGQSINVYDSGKLVVGGKDTEEVKALLQEQDQPGSQRKQWPTKKAAPARKVFVVYGHDSNARTELEAMLRRWGLEPLMLDQLPSAGQTIIEKLESVRQEASFAIVLATPDDEGHRTGHPDEKALRARQNVVLELGMMLAVLGRHRVAILLKEQGKMERPSDIQGLIYIPFKDNVKETALTLAKEIHAQGIAIDLRKV